MNSRIHQLAKKLSYERVGETCADLHTAGTAALARFHAWLNRRPWLDSLTSKEVTALEARLGELVAEVIDGAKERGTIPLRNALIAEMEDIADFDVNSLTEPYASLTDPQGNVWTLNRSASGRKLAVVDRPLWLLGTDDYFEAADSSLLNFGVGESATVVAAYRVYSPTASSTIIAKKQGVAASDVGYLIRQATGNPQQPLFQIADGSVTPTGAVSGNTANGEATMLAAVRSAQDGRLQFWRNGTFGVAQTDTTSSIANTLALRIGRLSGSGTSYGNFEFFAAAIFREALTDADLRRLAQELEVSP